MRTIALILANTIRVTFRRRSSFIVYLLLPVGGVVLALSIMNIASTPAVRIGIADSDGGVYAADLVRNIESWGNYVTERTTQPQLDALIADGKLDCGIVIPPGYSAGVPRGHIEKLEIVSLKGQTVTGALSSLIDQYSSGLADLAKAASGNPARFAELSREVRIQGVTLAEAKLADQHRSKGITLLGLGYFLMFVMLGAGITSQLILAEKSSRTYYRVCSAPVRPRQYLAGNGSAALLIIVAQIVLVLGIMRGVLRIETYVPDLLLGAILLLFGMVSVALGMLIAAHSPSTGVAVGVSTLIVTPSCMLSGCFWSITFMPPFMQKLALFMPQRWVLRTITQLQQGAVPGGVLVNFVVLAAFALTFFLAAVYGFARREESGQFV